MRFDLKKILKNAGLSEKEVARELFPLNNHPVQAFSRILNGTSKLDTDQVIKLSALSGMSISEMFGEAKTMDYTKGTHRIVTDMFTAELDFNNSRTRVYVGGSLRTELLLHTPSITLSEYILAIEEHLFN